MYCRKCGTKNLDDSKFCRECGASIKAPELPENESAGSGEGHTTQKKKMKGWLISLISVIAVLVVCAAVYFGITYFGNVEDKTDDVAESYEQLSDGGDSEQEYNGPMNTIDPSKPRPTANPDGGWNDSSELDTTSELYYDFGSLDYYEQAHYSSDYSSLQSFLYALRQPTWLYYASHENPEAVPVNGGYVDIAEYYTNAFTPAFNFDSYWIAEYLELDPADLSTTFARDENIYRAAQLNGIWTAYIDTETTTFFEGTQFSIYWVFFIDDNKELIESLAFYNAESDIILFISNFNIYMPYYSQTEQSTQPTAQQTDPPPQPPTPPQTVREPMTWTTDDAFRHVIISYKWVYTHSEDMEVDVTITSQYDNTPTEGLVWVKTFTNDNRYIPRGYDPTTKELVVDNTVTNPNCIYYRDFVVVFWGYIDYDGITYEKYKYMYIDSSGVLVERMAIYYSATDSYFFISNANIFEPTTEY